jgi:NAD(P)-dependent dehydrogenase (short-subunit alcohol dehydrogenase family)
MAQNHESSSRHVLITGASTGIGRECAAHLARLGFAVLAGVRNDADASTLEAIDHVKAIRVDVTCGDSIAAAAEKVRCITGEAGLCGLINNAGIGVFGPIEFVPIADWRRQFDVNIFGQIAVTQAMLPLLRQHVAHSGMWSARIVNMSSIAGRLAQPIFGPYCASKFAMEAFSDSLRLELRGQGIHVCVVEPGAIDTPIWHKGFETESAIAEDHPARKLYGAAITGGFAAAKKAAKTAIPAEAVAKAVAACMTRRRPRTRYLVGMDAKSGAIFRAVTPDRMVDLIVGKVFAMP